jgi:hypothetical protein
MVVAPMVCEWQSRRVWWSILDVVLFRQVAAAIVVAENRIVLAGV